MSRTLDQFVREVNESVRRMRQTFPGSETQRALRQIAQAAKGARRE